MDVAIRPKVDLKLRYVQKIKSSKFLRNAGIVATGTAGAQIITVVFAPLITRIYGPDAFGLLGAFIALASIIIFIATLTYPIAIVLPEKDSDAKGIAILSVYISIGVALVLAIIIFLYGSTLLSLLGAKEIEDYALLILPAVFFGALVQIAQQWCIRKKLFHISAKAAMIHAFAVSIAQVGIGWRNPVATVLIVSYVIGIGLHTLLFFLGLRIYGSEKKYEQAEDITRSSLIELAKKYYDFPIYRAPRVFIGLISLNLPVLMLAAFFSPALAGFYALSRKVLTMPTLLMSQAIVDVFYPKTVEVSHNNENLRNLIVKATVSIAAVGFTPYLIIIIFGPKIFGFIFGSEWVTAGEYARWLAFMLFFQLIYGPAVTAVPVLKLQKMLLIYEVISSVLRLVALYVGLCMLKNVIFAIATFSLFSSTIYIMVIFGVIYCSGDSFAKPVKKRSRQFKNYLTNFVKFSGHTKTFLISL
jgi:O-antigen/teichoic acid export membrane protein